MSDLRLGQSDSRRGRLRFFSARTHLGGGWRSKRKSAFKRQSDLQTGHHKLRNIDHGFVRCFAAGNFAIGLVFHTVAAIHRHLVFGGNVLVMVAGNGAMVRHATVRCDSEPGGAGEGGLQQPDGEETDECRGFTWPMVVPLAHAVKTPREPLFLYYARSNFIPHKIWAYGCGICSVRARNDTRGKEPGNRA
jgi:hypothetical protein